MSNPNIPPGYYVCETDDRMRRSLLLFNRYLNLDAANAAARVENQRGKKAHAMYWNGTSWEA